MRQLFIFKGKFQCWLYTVSHGQLLLRRNKEADSLTRVDVLFKNVGMIRLPTTFDDLSVFEAEINTVPDLRDELGKLGDIGKKAYLLHGDNWHGYVAAGSVTWIEDDGEYFEPSSLLE